MNRRFDGSELIKKIKNGEFKKDDIIINEVGWQYKYDGEDTFFDVEDNEEMCISEIIVHTFAILSEEIDIQAIEELTREIKRITADANNPHAYGMEIGTYDITKMGDKINEIIKAIKQLDKKIKE